MAQMNECSKKEWQDSDRELNSYYARLLEHLAGSDLDNLSSAQKAWTAYRELDCKAEKELYDEGTDGAIQFSACMAALAENRLAELKTTYKGRIPK